MKSVVFALPLMLSAAVSAQGVFSNKTQSILEKVIQDYPNQFHDIRGEQVQQTRQFTEYRSTVQLPGFTSGTVTRTNEGAGDEYSWSCALTETGGFERANIKYKEIFDQLHNSIVTSHDQKTFILTTGQYEAPASDKRFSHTVFSLLPGVGKEKKLRVELSLSQENKGWKIALRVYDHDQAGEIRVASTDH
jgi:hypothetical protein